MPRHGVAGIFGEHAVDVEVDPQNCAWTVKAADGRVLLQVPWRWAYDQTDLGRRVFHRKHFLTNDEYVAHSSRWEAFEVCMCAYPLTTERKQMLEARFPGVTTKPQYVVADPIWQPEPESRPAPRPSRARPRRTTDPVQTPEDALPSAPPTPPEVAHEPGERKLLL
jgi:hypothetical protein